MGGYEAAGSSVSLLVERRLNHCYAACMTELPLMVLLVAVVTGIDGLGTIIRLPIPTP